MADRTCIVTITDIRGVRHSVEVSAESLFDAAARALSAWRSSPWAPEIGPSTRLDVRVQAEAVITHGVTVQQLERWANGAAKSPDERIMKDRVRALLTSAKVVLGGSQ